MSKSTVLSIHGSNRLKERVKNDNRDISYLRLVLKNGKSKVDYCGDFYRFIHNKESRKNVKIKIYKENVFIFGSHNTHRLITTYPVPEKYIPTSNYELSNKVNKIAHIIYESESKTMTIKTSENEMHGKVSFYDSKPFTNIQLIDKENNIYNIETENIIEMVVESQTYIL